MLESIVTSLQFNNHSRWGIQPSQERVQALIMGFLDWMRESKEWTRLYNDWHKSPGPWSLPFALSRSFTRYREKKLSEPSLEPFLSAARALLELPSPMKAAAPLTESLLDAFSSLTHRLPYEVRLPYQLHLEGLLDDEIATLLGKTTSQIKACIAEAKLHLQDDILKRSSAA